MLPADVLPADVLPADVLPGDVLPADVLPADVLPADVLPADVLPAGVHLVVNTTINISILTPLTINTVNSEGGGRADRGGRSRQRWFHKRNFFIFR